jgi:hypothetical protein
MICEYRIKSGPAQFLIRRKHFPGLGSPAFELTFSGLPSRAEGWLARPRWEKLAPTFGEALHRVLDATIHSRRNLFWSTPSVSSSKTNLAIDSPATNIPLKVHSTVCQRAHRRRCPWRS